MYQRANTTNDESLVPGLMNWDDSGWFGMVVYVTEYGESSLQVEVEVRWQGFTCMFLFKCS